MERFDAHQKTVMRRVVISFFIGVVVLTYVLACYDGYKKKAAIRADPRQRSVTEFLEVFNAAMAEDGFLLYADGSPWQYHKRAKRTTVLRAIGYAIAALSSVGIPTGMPPSSALLCRSL